MPAHDMRQHTEMWNSFLKLVGYSICGIIVILAAMAVFLL